MNREEEIKRLEQELAAAKELANKYQRDWSDENGDCAEFIAQAKYDLAQIEKDRDHWKAEAERLRVDADEKDRFNTSLAMDNQAIRNALTELLEALAYMTDLDEMDGEEFTTKSARLDAAETAAKKFTESALIDAAIYAARKENGNG